MASSLLMRPSLVDYPTHTLTFQMDETPPGRDTAGASDVSTTNYWDDVNQELIIFEMEHEGCYDSFLSSSVAREKSLRLGNLLYQ